VNFITAKICSYVHPRWHADLKTRMAAAPSSRHLHWKVPATIIGSFAASIALAIGHHFLYHNLDGKRVDRVAYDQQINLAIGTAFSFLVRSALVTAIGTSYWQLFWITLHRKTLMLSTVDSLAGLLGAPQEFLNLNAIRASPTLVSLALLSWLIPFAAVIPPATLSVQSLNSLDKFTMVLGVSCVALRAGATQGF
jgi:hypothetical protein